MGLEQGEAILRVHHEDNFYVGVAWNSFQLIVQHWSWRQQNK